MGHNHWVAATSLDWTKPLPTQLHPCQYQNLDYIIASDCVWLMSMLEGLLTTVQTIFDESTTTTVPKLLLSFQRRDSEMFTTVDRILQELQTVRGWKVTCLAWYPAYDPDDDPNEMSSPPTPASSDPNNPPQNVTPVEKEVFLFQVTPR